MVDPQQTKLPPPPLKRRLIGHAIEAAFRLASALGRHHRWSRRLLQELDIQSDTPYGEGIRRLDVYRSRDAPRDQTLPVLLYVHGGGFRILSKETHWPMAGLFARAGYLVVTIDYRLAPASPFPAALEDCVDALCWLGENVERLGGDPQRLIFAGESAGANLVTALAIACAQRRPEAFAQLAFATGLIPRVVLPLCGILQVSQPQRLFPATTTPWMRQRLLAVSEGYLGGAPPTAARELADPLCVLEAARPGAFERPLPAFYASVGDRDPLAEDTRRLHRALRRLGVSSTAELYRGEPHAFQALLWRPQAQLAWRSMLDVCASHLARSPSSR